jgi:hypothetical protein
MIMLGQVITIGALATALAVIAAPALRERGRRFEERRTDRIRHLGRPLTPAELWDLYE